MERVFSIIKNTNSQKNTECTNRLIF